VVVEFFIKLLFSEQPADRRKKIINRTAAYCKSFHHDGTKKARLPEPAAGFPNLMVFLSNRGFVPLAGAHPQHLLNRQDKYLAVADLAALGGLPEHLNQSPSAPPAQSVMDGFELLSQAVWRSIAGSRQLDHSASSSEIKSPNSGSKIRHQLLPRFNFLLIPAVVMLGCRLRHFEGAALIHGPLCLIVLVANFPVAAGFKRSHVAEPVFHALLFRLVNE
jgi:hypothetical protein